ncbi:hypothetical protein GCK32_011688, partial [Trichostrongylus colubriformis]
ILQKKAPEGLPLLEKLVDLLTPNPAEIVEAEKRARSIIIHGIPELGAEFPPSKRRKPRKRRRSMTPTELEQDKQLRSSAKELNQSAPEGEKIFVVFRQQNHIDFQLVHFDTPTMPADVLCFETLGFSLEFIRFIVIYRPPNQSVPDDDQLCNLLSDLCSSSPHVVLL